jgi:hypothetical protein
MVELNFYRLLGSKAVGTAGKVFALSVNNFNFCNVYFQANFFKPVLYFALL